MPSDNNPQPERLLTRVLKGGAVLAVGAVFERGLRFVVNMILARILAPEQFGLLALVLAANGLFEVLTEVGIGQSVIQNKKGDTAPFLNVAWWFSGVRGVFLYVVGILAAPSVSAFYHDVSLTPLLRVAFLTMLFNGLTNPHLFVLQKQMKFGRYVIITLGAALSGTLLCLGLALVFPTVWALVAGFVAEAVLRCGLSYVLCPFHFQWRFDRDSWKELLHFSKGMAGLGLFAFIFMQADIFLMGRMCSTETLGLYSMAMSLAAMPQMLFSRFVGPMVLPVLSDTQSRMDLLRDRLLRMTRMLFLFGLPLTTCLAIFSTPTLTIVYGPRYATVDWAFGWLAFGSLIYLSGVLIASTYLALARPDVIRWFTITRVIVLAVLLYPAIRWFGPAGAAGSRVICLVLAGVVQQINLSRLIDLPVLQYLSTMKEGLGISLVICVPAIILRLWIRPAFVQLIVLAGLCGLCCGFILWRNRGSLRELIRHPQPLVQVD
jgi:lipopolysaccharide exporter